MANENATKIQLRHDSSANWFANNPILAEGEVGIEIDKNRMKVGNGVSHYNDLEYFSDTVDYNELINKPQINSIGLMGNLSLHELGIQAEGDYATVLTLTEGLSEKADKADTYTKTEIDTEFSSLIKVPAIDGHDGEWLTNKDGVVKWENLGDSVVTNEELTTALEPYALKTNIPTKNSQLENDSDFVTLTELAESDYVTNTNLTTKLGEYVTNTALAEEGYAKNSELAQVAKSGSYNDLTNKPTIPTVPENITTQGNTFNGANQLVKLEADGKLPALDGSKLTGISSGTSDYSVLSNKPQINSVELSGNKTLDQLGIQAKGNYLVSSDLNNYALKSELPTNTSDLTNDSGFLTSIPSEYVTETELNSSLEDKADTATTLSGYGITDAYTKTEADGKYATKTELSNKADTSALSNYATTSALTEGLAEKADTSALPASTSLMNGTAPSVADFAGADAEGLKTELNAFLAQLKTRGVIA